MPSLYLCFIFVLFTNLWIWRIFAQNGLIAIILLLATTALYLSQKRKPARFVQKTFTAIFLLLLFFQWKSTQISSLSYLDNDQQRIQQMRLREYPPVALTLGSKKIWIPIAHWFEGRKETISLFRIKDNFSEIVDPALYFFANHPRERVGVAEFEKFPYILLPFFLIGILSKKFKIKSKIFVFSLLTPIILASFIGKNNELGPFSLFPFMTIATAYGLSLTSERLKKIPKKKRRNISFVFLAVFALVVIQVISYAKF